MSAMDGFIVSGRTNVVHWAAEVDVKFRTAWTASPAERIVRWYSKFRDLQDADLSVENARDRCEPD